MSSAAMRVAVVGLGEAGSQIHLPALSAIRPTTVVGVCDVDANKRTHATRRWRTPGFADVGTLLTETQPGTVIVATPPETHAAIALQCLEAGAHVVVEKPFATSVAEADTILAAARARRLGVAVNHEFRWMPIFRAVREHLRRPGADHPVTAQIWQLLDRQPWADAGWRGALVSRTLYEAGVHLVDLLLDVFDEQPVAVTASLSTGGHSGQHADAVVVVMLEFTQGRLAQLVQNRLCHGESHYADLRVDTARDSYRASFGGRARVSMGLLRSTRPHVRIEFGRSGIAWRERGQQRVQLARNPTNPLVTATRALMADTLEAFAAGQPPPLGGDIGRNVLRIIAACYHAARTGRRVPLTGAGAESLDEIRLGARASE